MNPDNVLVLLCSVFLAANAAVLFLPENRVWPINAIAVVMLSAGLGVRFLA